MRPHVESVANGASGNRLNEHFSCGRIIWLFNGAPSIKLKWMCAVIYLFYRLIYHKPMSSHPIVVDGCVTRKCGFNLTESKWTTASGSATRMHGAAERVKLIELSVYFFFFIYILLLSLSIIIWQHASASQRTDGASHNNTRYTHFLSQLRAFIFFGQHFPLRPKPISLSSALGRCRRGRLRRAGQ